MNKQQEREERIADKYEQIACIFSEIQNLMQDICDDYQAKKLELQDKNSEQYDEILTLKEQLNKKSC